MSKSPVLLLIACGDIGSALGLRFAEKDWRVIGLRRDVSALPPSIETLAADITDEETLEPLADIAADYVVFTLTPAAFSEEGYQRIFRQGLNNVLKRLNTDRLRRLFFTSSTSVYHQRDSEWVDEDSATRPRRFSGKAILAAERALLQSGLPATVIRYGGIYGPGREQVLRRVSAGRCAPYAPVHYSNRIHSADAVNVLAYLLEQDLDGGDLEECYLAVDDAPTPIAEVHHWLAGELGVPYHCDDELTTRAGSKRCSNRRLRETGFRFQYPDYRAGYRAILAEWRAKAVTTESTEGHRGKDNP